MSRSSKEALGTMCQRILLGNTLATLRANVRDPGSRSMVFAICSDCGATAAVKALAMTRAEDLGREAAGLQAMRQTLLELAERCHGDEHPDCPIIERMSGETDGTR